MSRSVPSASEVQATFAATLFDEWITRGLRDVVLAPGSRSTPLALAAASRERADPPRSPRRAKRRLLRARPCARHVATRGDGDHERYRRRGAARLRRRSRPRFRSAHRGHSRPSARAARRRRAADHGAGPSLRDMVRRFDDVYDVSLDSATRLARRGQRTVGRRDRRGHIARPRAPEHWHSSNR